jgi:hypothetical protein
MRTFVWLGLLLASSSVNLVDKEYQIPAGDWRYVAVSLGPRPALLAADVEVEAGAADIQAAVTRKEDLDRIGRGMPRRALAMAAPDSSARLRYYARTPGDYAVVVENRDPNRATTVRVRMWVDFGAGQALAPTELSPRRRLAVAAISLAAFFGIVGWSARRIWGHIRARAV